MPNYIILSNWTQQGIQEIKESPERLERVKAIFRDAGAELKEFHMTMGRHDVVVIAEAPDDETMARIALMIERTGAARTETLRAFTEDQYRQIISSVP